MEKTRELTDEEKKIFEKNKPIMEEEKSMVEGEIKRLNFNLNFLLEHSYKKRRKDLERELKIKSKELKDCDMVLNDINDKLKNGVKIREKEEK